MWNKSRMWKNTSNFGVKMLEHWWGDMDEIIFVDFFSHQMWDWCSSSTGRRPFSPPPDPCRTSPRPDRGFLGPSSIRAPAFESPSPWRRDKASPARSACTDRRAMTSTGWRRRAGPWTRPTACRGYTSWTSSPTGARMSPCRDEGKTEAWKREKYCLCCSEWNGGNSDDARTERDRWARWGSARHP